MTPQITHPHLIFESKVFSSDGSVGDLVPQRNQGIFRFENGWTVSVVYGNFLYSSPVPSVGQDFPSKFKNVDCPAATVEVAIFDPHGEFVPFMDGQSVKGWVTPDELVDILSWVKSRPSTSTNGDSNA